MSDPAIVVDSLSKLYRIGLKEKLADTLGGAFVSWLKSPMSNYRSLRKLSQFSADEESEDVIWALKDVSFTVEHGEVIGVIGRNGAGKSTLLKIISRITKPSSGRALLRGRVASLLEVGTGFHMDLTGRENIYLNATILGMSKKEVDRKFDEIVHFSGVEKFIDTPFKRYSSGMKVRLGFSVAAYLEAEILLVDEVLAVGDVAFQQKCVGRMQEIASKGRTVLFVSHDMAAIERLCQRCILLEEGQLAVSGAPQEVISSYLGLQDKPTLEWRRNDERPEHAYLRRVTLIDHDGVPLRNVTTASDVAVEIECVVPRPNPSLRFGITLRDSHENPIFSSHPIDGEVPYPNEAGVYTYRVFFPPAFLMPRRYFITVAVYAERIWADALARALSFDVQPGASLATSEGKVRKGTIQVRCKWDLTINDLAQDKKGLLRSGNVKI